MDAKTKTIQWLSNKKNIPKLAVILGAAGILMVMLSGLPKSQEKPVADSSGTASATQNTQYIKELEQQLVDILSGIEGVGQVRLMITLDRSEEYVYAQEYKTNSTSSDDTGKTQRVENSENKYVIFEGPGGNSQALLKAQIQPKIKGVVVVCEGANNVVVVATVTDAIKTALDIGSNRVCVTKLKQNSNTQR